MIKPLDSGFKSCRKSMYLLSLTRPLIRLALKGGAIASSNAANSDLTADALTLQNISNQMNYNPDSCAGANHHEFGKKLRRPARSYLEHTSENSRDARPTG